MSIKTNFAGRTFLFLARVALMIFHHVKGIYLPFPDASLLFMFVLTQADSESSQRYNMQIFRKIQNSKANYLSKDLHVRCLTGF